jgi:tetratricopeptide (TPR) repeat protein
LKKKISKEFLPKILVNAPTTDGGFKNEVVDQLIEQRAKGILEAQYHFLMANDFNRATEVAIIMGHELLQLSYVEDLKDNLEKINPAKVSDEYSMDLKILKGDVFNALGNYEDALKLYQESVAIAEGEDNRTKLAELYRKIGFIKEKMSDYDSAIELLDKSLEISKILGDAQSISDAYGGLGGIYWKMSDYDKSNEYYNKCLESADKITDLPGKAKTFLSLGMLSAKRGQFEESIKYYEKCLDILDKGKGMDGVNYKDFYENLGDHYLKTIFSYYIQSNGQSESE